MSRRFPIEQAGKVRPIDDLSQSQINATVTCFEQATVDGPDVICAFAVFLMRCLLEKGKSTALLGRALDLASAYRQLAISDDSKCHAYLSVYSPASGRAELFRQVALPFGSRTAVNAFIRCARFLQWVAARCLKIPVSCYFDDFVSFTYPALSSNTQAAMCLMLDILGWLTVRDPRAMTFPCCQSVGCAIQSGELRRWPFGGLQHREKDSGNSGLCGRGHRGWQVGQETGPCFEGPLSLLRRVYFWPTWESCTTEYNQACLQCAFSNWPVA